MTPRISVIVPVYNAAATLAVCVESILAQTYRDFELILIDDGSTDDSGAMCDAYATGEAPAVRVLHQANGGLMRAWMAGVGLARGEYLCLIDSDDWVEPVLLADLMGGLRSATEYGDVVSDVEHPEAGTVVCCNHVIDHIASDTAAHMAPRVIRSERMRHGAAPGVYTGERLRQDIHCRILGNENRTVSMSRCMKLIPAQLIRRNLSICDPAIRMGEDVNIMLPVLLDASCIVILADSYDYHYIYNDASITHTYDAGLEKNTDRLFAVMKEALLARSDLIPTEASADMLERERSFFYLLEFKNELRNSTPGRTGRIRDWLRRRQVTDTIRRHPMAVSDRTNRLLYGVMRYPTWLGITLTGALYDWKHGGLRGTSS